MNRPLERVTPRSAGPRNRGFDHGCLRDLKAGSGG